MLAELARRPDRVIGHRQLLRSVWGPAHEDHVDYLRIVMRNLRQKLARYAAHGVPVVLGGTLCELAIRDGRVEEMVAWLHELGLRHVEVSDGTLALEGAHKRELIARLATEFTVFSEVGSKDDSEIMAPYRWVEQIQGELEAGAWKVIAEARGFTFTAPPLAYCTDNAAMIALAGAERLAMGISDPLEAVARPLTFID